MSEPLSIHHISTTPIPFGVSVKWKWPEASHWFSRLELQYLLSDGRLVTELIRWPVTEKYISGLKAGERLQVRLRPLPLKSAAREWLASDWIDGVPSTDASDIIESIERSIKKAGWSVSSSGSASFNGVAIHGEVNVTEGKTKYNCGLKVGIDNFKSQISLSDEMKTAVINAVRESDLFTTLQANIDAQTASIIGLQTTSIIPRHGFPSKLHTSDQIGKGRRIPSFCRCARTCAA